MLNFCEKMWSKHRLHFLCTKCFSVWFWAVILPGHVSWDFPIGLKHQLHVEVRCVCWAYAYERMIFGECLAHECKCWKWGTLDLDGWKRCACVSMCVRTWLVTTLLKEGLSVFADKYYLHSWFKHTLETALRRFVLQNCFYRLFFFLKIINVYLEYNLNIFLMYRIAQPLGNTVEVFTLVHYTLVCVVSVDGASDPLCNTSVSCDLVTCQSTGSRINECKRRITFPSQLFCMNYTSELKPRLIVFCLFFFIYILYMRITHKSKSWGCSGNCA